MINYISGLVFVVLDQREARIYKAEPIGSLPERITPFHPQGNGRHLRSVDDDFHGQCQPVRKGFYEAVARSLQGAGQILLFGTGSDASRSLQQLLAELERHHADVARHIVGSVAVSERHLTEEQLLAKAREFYQPAVMDQNAEAQNVPLDFSADHVTGKNSSDRFPASSDRRISVCPTL